MIQLNAKINIGKSYTDYCLLFRNVYSNTDNILSLTEFSSMINGGITITINNIQFLKF